jgi:predicted transposase YbfD/YdcC
LGQQDYAGCSQHQTTDGGHGRIEVRRGYALAIEGRGLIDTEGWAGLKTILMIEAERRVLKTGSDDEKTSHHRRYYISSLDADAARLMQRVRHHWHIENQLHWVLDVAFDEDQSRIRRSHAPENMATVRRIALNLLKQDKTLKVGVANKRLRAGWDPTYLTKIIQQI